MDSIRATKIASILVSRNPISIVSAYFHESNNVESITEAIVTDKVLSSWEKYLMTGKSRLRASSKAFGLIDDTFPTTMTAASRRRPVRTLWINYRIRNGSGSSSGSCGQEEDESYSRELFTETFLEDSFVDWSAIGKGAVSNEAAYHTSTRVVGSWGNVSPHIPIAASFGCNSNSNSNSQQQQVRYLPIYNLKLYRVSNNL